MRLFASCLAVVAVLAAAPGVRAAIDGSEPVICATMEIMECVPDAGCVRMSAAAVEIPRFLQIDFAAQKITRTRAGGEDVSSPIERSETIDGRMILQGAEDGIEGVPDGIGWSLAIDQASGDMVLTGSGMAVGFVIFGACTHF